MKPLTRNTAIDLAVKLSEGNPGAATVLRELMWYSKWFEMLQYMERTGLKGPAIWILYKDTYHRNIEEFVKHLSHEMAKDAEFKHLYP